MNLTDELSVDEASRLAVTATAADLEDWARRAADHGRLGLDALVGVLDAVRAESVPQHSTPPTFLTLAAS